MHRADVDDAAASAWDHGARNRLSDEKHAVEIDRHQFAPGLFREFFERRAPLDAGIVDENVDRTDLGLDARDARAHLRSVRYIESRAMRRAAVGDDLRRDGRDLVGAPAVDDDLSARLRQAQRERAPDAARRSRHQGDAPAKAEQTFKIGWHEKPSGARGGKIA